MAVAPGTRIGPYELGSLIGKGGMGEVYRARDTKLHRDTAIKMLPELFARDPERLARFRREAHVLASLNHSGIAQIYGLEETGEITALVMELVEGHTLAERIAQGPLPLDEAVPIARQIADALASAHDQGVVHRDLKPANIKVRPDGTVKVLDFGLAKALVGDAVASASDISHSPTLTSPAMSQLGAILGTAAYMAPEQARGRTVDRRADVWAFGCVLYEMLSGARAFDGEDVSMTLSMVLQREPDWSALPAGLPSTLVIFLKRALEKDPARRLRDVGDLRLALDGAFESPAAASAAPPRPASRARTIALVSAGTLAGALVTGLLFWRVGPAGSPDAKPVSRYSLDLAPGRTFSPVTVVPFAITPDGRHIVFVSAERRSSDNTNQLSVRSLDRWDSPKIPGGDPPVGSLFLSPDGEWIGFNRGPGAQIGFRKIRLGGGPAATLTSANVVSFGGASWGSGGQIVIARNAGMGGLALVPDTGGEPVPLTKPTPPEAHLYPFFLPDGRHVLFTHRTLPQPDRVAVLDIASGTIRDLLPGSWPRYAASGHLLFTRENALWATLFDLDTLETQGEAVPVLEDIQPGRIAISASGTLVYAPLTVPGRTAVWVDRKGSQTPLPLAADNYWLPRLSPDGQRLAVGIDQDIWTIDLARGGRMRLTFGQTSSYFPFTWTPDGTRITFAAPAGTIYQVPADGRGQPQPLLTGKQPQWPTSWSPDGSTLAFYANAPDTARDLWIWAARPGFPALFVGTAYQERAGRFSPDGRWLAYVSDESGKNEVYVRPYPGPGGQVTVSLTGGTEPTWSRTGRELFYRSGVDVFAVDVQSSPAFHVGAPRRLFGNEEYVVETAGVGGNPAYDVHPDGRFLMFAAPPVSADVRVVVNWFEELKKLVPARR